MGSAYDNLFIDISVLCVLVTKLKKSPFFDFQIPVRDVRFYTAILIIMAGEFYLLGHFFEAHVVIV